MIYRRALTDDHPRMLEIEKQLEKLSSDMAIERSSPFLRGEKGALGRIVPFDAVFLAEDHGEIVGMVGAMKVTKRSWYVSHFWVDVRYRNQGVGRGLMEAAAAYHKQSGCVAALATPIPTAVEAYSHLGFKPVATTMEWEYA